MHHGISRACDEHTDGSWPPAVAFRQFSPAWWQLDGLGQFGGGSWRAFFVFIRRGREREEGVQASVHGANGVVVPVLCVMRLSGKAWSRM